MSSTSSENHLPVDEKKQKRSQKEIKKKNAPISIKIPTKITGRKRKVNENEQNDSKKRKTGNNDEIKRNTNINQIRLTKIDQNKAKISKLQEQRNLCIKELLFLQKNGNLPDYNPSSENITTNLKDYIKMTSQPLFQLTSNLNNNLNTNNLINKINFNNNLNINSNKNINNNNNNLNNNNKNININNNINNIKLIINNNIIKDDKKSIDEIKTVANNLSDHPEEFSLNGDLNLTIPSPISPLSSEFNPLLSPSQLIIHLNNNLHNNLNNLSEISPPISSNISSEISDHISHSHSSLSSSSSSNFLIIDQNREDDLQSNNLLMEVANDQLLSPNDNQLNDHFDINNNNINEKNNINNNNNLNINLNNNLNNNNEEINEEEKRNNENNFIAPQKIIKKIIQSTNATLIRRKQLNEEKIRKKVTELQKRQKWSGDRMGRIAEIPRNFTHWDFLLEEMIWLSNDFLYERKKKISLAKKFTNFCKVEKNFKLISKVNLKWENLNLHLGLNNLNDNNNNNNNNEMRKLKLNLLIQKFNNENKENNNDNIDKDVEMEDNNENNENNFNDLIKKLQKNYPENKTIKLTTKNNNKENIDNNIENNEKINENNENNNNNNNNNNNKEEKEKIIKKFQLREYQEIGFDWIISNYKNNFSSLLFDEISLGKKTISTCLLAYLANNFNYQKNGPFLVVSSNQKQANGWKNEISSKFSFFSILLIENCFISAKKLKKLKENSFNVVILSYPLLLSLFNSFINYNNKKININNDNNNNDKNNNLVDNINNNINENGNLNDNINNDKENNIIKEIEININENELINNINNNSENNSENKININNKEELIDNINQKEINKIEDNNNKNEDNNKIDNNINNNNKNEIEEENEVEVQEDENELKKELLSKLIYQKEWNYSIFDHFFYNFDQLLINNQLNNKENNLNNLNNLNNNNNNENNLNNNKIENNIWDCLINIKTKKGKLILNNGENDWEKYSLKQYWNFLHFLIPSLPLLYPSFFNYYLNNNKNNINNNNNLNINNENNNLNDKNDLNYNNNKKEIKNKIKEISMEIIKLFILSRTKYEVENQMPKKINHFINCNLSNRQKENYIKILQNYIEKDNNKNNKEENNNNKNNNNENNENNINISNINFNNNLIKNNINNDNDNNNDNINNKFDLILNTIKECRKVCDHPDLYNEISHPSSYYFNSNLLFNYYNNKNKYKNNNNNLNNNLINNNNYNIQKNLLISVFENQFDYFNNLNLNYLNLTKIYSSFANYFDSKLLNEIFPLFSIGKLINNYNEGENNNNNDDKMEEENKNENNLTDNNNKNLFKNKTKKLEINNENRMKFNEKYFYLNLNNYDNKEIINERNIKKLFSLFITSYDKLLNQFNDIIRNFIIYIMPVITSHFNPFIDKLFNFNFNSLLNPFNNNLNNENNFNNKNINNNLNNNKIGILERNHFTLKEIKTTFRLPFLYRPIKNSYDKISFEKDSSKLNELNYLLQKLLLKFNNKNKLNNKNNKLNNNNNNDKMDEENNNKENNINNLNIYNNNINEENNNKNKVIIIAEKIKTIDIIEKYLSLKQFKFLRLEDNLNNNNKNNNNNNNSQNLIDKFNNSKKDFILLCSTRNLNLKLNFEFKKLNVKNIIFYNEDWNFNIHSFNHFYLNLINLRHNLHYYYLNIDKNFEFNLIQSQKNYLIHNENNINNENNNINLIHNENNLINNSIEELNKNNNDNNLNNNTGIENLLYFLSLFNEKNNLPSSIIFDENLLKYYKNINNNDEINNLNNNFNNEIKNKELNNLIGLYEELNDRNLLDKMEINIKRYKEEENIPKIDFNLKKIPNQKIEYQLEEYEVYFLLIYFILNIYFKSI